MKLQGKHCKISDEKFLGYNGCKLNKQGYRKTQQLLGTSWLPGTHFGGGGLHSLIIIIYLSRTYKLILLKGDILHYSQSLIEPLQENAKLVTVSFHSKLLGDKDFKDH